MSNEPPLQDYGPITQGPTVLVRRSEVDSSSWCIFIDGQPFSDVDHDKGLWGTKEEALASAEFYIAQLARPRA